MTNGQSAKRPSRLRTVAAPLAALVFAFGLVAVIGVALPRHTAAPPAAPILATGTSTAKPELTTNPTTKPTTTEPPATPIGITVHGKPDFASLNVAVIQDGMQVYPAAVTGQGKASVTAPLANGAVVCLEIPAGWQVSSTPALLYEDSVLFCTKYTTSAPAFEVKKVS